MNGAARTSLALVVAVAGPMLTASCANLEPNATASGDGGAAVMDVAATDAVADAADPHAPETCAPAAVTATFALPPPVRHRDACPNGRFIEDVVACTFESPQVPAAVCADARAEVEWPACQRCLFGFADGAGSDADDAASAVPIVVTDGLAHLDVGACLTLERPDARACAEKYDRQEACHAAACAHCVLQGKPSYEECTVAADVDPSRCKPHVVTDLTCGLALTDAGCEVNHDFFASAVSYGAHFCLDGGR